MSIFYVFVANDPNNTGVYPPSVSSSPWADNVALYFQTNNIVSSKQGTSYVNILPFDSVTDLNNWVAAHTLSDPTLVADLNTWKSAHGVSFNSYYLDTANSTVITGPVS